MSAEDRDAGWEGVGWQPPPDVLGAPSAAAPSKPSSGTFSGDTHGALDAFGYSIAPPHEYLSGVPCQRPGCGCPGALRHVQLLVTARCADAEHARFELARLGLIPDPYEPTQPLHQAKKETNHG